MQFIYSTLAFLLLRAVAAAPDAGAPYPIRRQESHPVTTSTHLNATGTAAATGAYIGSFTENAGVYEITSASGYVLVAGHTLSPGGGDALVGGAVVTDASSGVLVGGSLVALTPEASLPTSTTVETTVTSGSTTFTTTTAITAAATTSSGGGAAATGVPLAGAVLGGLMGVLLL